MLHDSKSIRMILGFKLKYLRVQRGYSLEELADHSGLSRAYIHDIERGRRYPKPDKIKALADALDVSYDYMVSLKADKRIQPVIDLLDSPWVREFPLEEFGLKPDKLFELFTTVPDKVNAFVSTIVKVTRNYQLKRENLYLAALRSYQELHDNYFPLLEEAALAFVQTHALHRPGAGALEGVLSKTFGIRVDREVLSRQPDLAALRSFFSPEARTLYLRRGLSTAQERFLLARELGFQQLEPSVRPYETRVQEADSFELLLHNFEASYFAAALLMPEEELLAGVQQFAAQPGWQPGQLLNLLSTFDLTPEMLFQRLTNLLPHHLGLRDLFFIRLSADEQARHIRMTKELHLSRLNNPYANELDETYCRRWVSVSTMQALAAGAGSPLADAQISDYWQTDNAYLVLSIAQANPPEAHSFSSVSIGMLVNTQLRQTFRFLDDPALPTRLVHTTCERCGIADCSERAAPPLRLQEDQAAEARRKAMEDLRKEEPEKESR